MKNSLFGVIVKVNDLDRCRKFYQDVLDLGDPVLDSSFWVEFQTESGFSLLLEKTAAGFLEHESAATSFICRVKDVDEVSERFRLHGYRMDIEQRTHEGEVLYRCQDPERNVFYIFSPDTRELAE